MNTPSSALLSDHVRKMREYFSKSGLSGFLVTRGDEYLGEYVAPYAERLAWLTGFTGSAGLAILLDHQGAVFSDGRYIVQMEQQVPHDLWERHHISKLPPKEWLARIVQQEKHPLKIGFDPRLVSKSQYESWQTESVEFIALTENPIDLIWEDQPPAPQAPVFAHELVYAGEESLSKRERIASQLKKQGQYAMIIADCTSLAWLLNIRSHDVPTTPVAHGYGILYDDGKTDLFIRPERVETPLDERVTLCPPETLPGKLAGLTGKTIRLDPATTSLWFISRLEEAGATIILAPDLCTLPKAIKNKIEQEGARKAQLQDAIAMVHFLHWVEQEAIGKSETELAAKLTAFRARSPDYREDSFETISALGPNGAYPHYRAIKGRDSIVTANQVYLVDSGGQYPYGTTDLTRTLWIGPDRPPAALRAAYTNVLKGNIALAQARFPTDIPGYRLDSLARQFLWQAGLDYDHGTGHGIGSYLSVHEGPQSISPAPRPTGLKAGMIISDEPGYYKEGHYGIRIENLLLTRQSRLDKDVSGENRDHFLEFEVLTLVPIDKQLIEPDLLTTQERDWLDQYHRDIRKTLLPYLDKSLHAWLIKSCAPLL